MKLSLPTFTSDFSPHARSLWGDAVVLATLIALIGICVHLAYEAPSIIKGPTVSLSLSLLPIYAAFSLARILAAYLLSLLFMFSYGYAAAYYRQTRWILLPLLDVLQSVPLLSFLPFILLSFSAIFPPRLAIEFASIALLFTCLGWNLIYAWYQSLTTLPQELREASNIFHFNRWMRFKNLELPFASMGLVWNSMISWANGWFFLMAAEIFTVGQRDFRLPGLGAYLKEAASQGNLRAIGWGILLLVFIIVGMDQLLWRPLIAWSDRRKLEMTEGSTLATSWFYDALVNSHLIQVLRKKFSQPLLERLDRWFLLRPKKEEKRVASRARRYGLAFPLSAILIALLLYGIFYAGKQLITVSSVQWLEILLGALASFLRVFVALILALLWTVPVGVAIGTNPRLAKWLQPLVQVTASIPATALFPAFLLLLIRLPAGLNLAAVLLMLMGTQWYLLFNIIAGANAIPQDLKYTVDLMRLSRFERWRTLILPSIFPYLITGSIVATGGAWNASIVAEYVEFGGKTFFTHGLGSLIAQATAAGNYPLLLAATFSMIFTVVFINRFIWQKLYTLAEEKYRLE